MGMLEVNNFWWVFKGAPSLFFGQLPRSTLHPEFRRKLRSSHPPFATACKIPSMMSVKTMVFGLVGPRDSRQSKLRALLQKYFVHSALDLFLKQCTLHGTCMQSPENLNSKSYAPKL